MKTLEDLGLERYPFSVVPPPEPTTFWADRRRVREAIKDVVKTWSLSPRSGIYLLWADFGAGKTHALRFIQGLSAEAPAPAVGVYCDVPSTAADMRALYSQITTQLPEDVLAECIYFHRRTHGENRWLNTPWLRGDRDTPRALWALAEFGNHVQGDVARRWLRAGSVGRRDLDSIGVAAAIKSAQDCVRVLSSIINLIQATGRHSRFVLMLDEFQRIGQVNQRRAKDVNMALVSLYNACPERMALFLSYSFGNPENIKYMVAPELLSRVERQLRLENMTLAEAHEFVAELLGASAPKKRRTKIFSDAALNELLGRLNAEVGAKLTPRRVMQVCAAVLNAALLSDETFPIAVATAQRLYVSPPVEGPTSS